MFKWTKISQAEMAALKMTAESAVYFTLKMFMGTNGIAYPAASTLAEITGFSVKQIRRATKSLKEKGLIVRDGFDSRSQTARYKLGRISEGVSQERGRAIPQERGRGGTPQKSPNIENNKENNNKEQAASGPTLDDFIFAGLTRID